MAELKAFSKCHARGSMIQEIVRKSGVSDTEVIVTSPRTYDSKSPAPKVFFRVDISGSSIFQIPKSGQSPSAWALGCSDRKSAKDMGG